MKKTIFLALIAIIAIVLVSSQAYAFNLGSYVKNDYASIQAGGSGRFEILLWADEDKPIRVNIDSIESPQGWRIDINPGSISIDRSDGSENVIVSGKSIKASTVYVDAYPTQIASGDYDIKIRASAASSQGELPSSQERFFTLKAFISRPAMNDHGNPGTTVSLVNISNVSENITRIDHTTTTIQAIHTSTTLIPIRFTSNNSLNSSTDKGEVPFFSGAYIFLKSAADSVMKFFTWKWLAR